MVYYLRCNTAAHHDDVTVIVWWPGTPALLHGASAHHDHHYDNVAQVGVAVVTKLSSVCQHCIHSVVDDPYMAVQADDANTVIVVPTTTSRRSA